MKIIKSPTEEHIYQVWLDNGELFDGLEGTDYENGIDEPILNFQICTSYSCTSLKDLKKEAVDHAQFMNGLMLFIDALEKYPETENVKVYTDTDDGDSFIHIDIPFNHPIIQI